MSYIQTMKLTGETKLFLSIIVISVVLIVGALFLFSRQEQSSANQTIYPREEMIASHTQIKGNASASAYLVEFSDFQCPACQAFAPLVDSLITQYGDALTVAYRHYPLPQHAYAEKAAKAAQAAAKQGKFWEMHDELFANQTNLSDQTLSEIVKKLELDETTFNQDLESREIKDMIAEDIAAGNRFGVNSTPTFFLNGQKITMRSALDLTNAIESAINP